MTENADPQRRSPLHDAHVEAGARFTGFGGWEMPVSFAGIREEHHAVRNAAGVFDVSHMGEVEVVGPDAEELMQRLTSNDVTALEDGDAQYAMITDEAGTILDDTIVYRLNPESFLFVPNAGHDAETTARWVDHRDAWDLDASVENVTEEYAMLAVQGPDATGIVAGEAVADLEGLGGFEFVETPVAGADCLVSRTGYTGEAGFEVLTARDDADALWDAFVYEHGCEPCGLGARDTLRTEMGFLLSGQDFDPEENPRNPFEADVAFAVDLATEFVGRDALVRVRDAGGPDERLAGFVLEERGVPRHGYPILAGEGDGDDDGAAGPADADVDDSDDTRASDGTREVVGEVTSGTMSPTLGEPIGLGYLPVGLTEPGTRVAVEIRGRAVPATVRATPFITRDGASP